MSEPTTIYKCKKCGHFVFSLDPYKIDLEHCPNCNRKLTEQYVYSRKL